MGELPHLKLYSPREREFWIEFQGVPEKDQVAARDDLPLKFEGAWYSLPRFRFMRLVLHEPQVSRPGFKYAAPRMMALANLLAHPRLGDARVTLADGRKGGLRSAKDLGRALAIARLTPTTEVERWPASWLAALKKGFPGSWSGHAKGVDRGLNRLLARPNAMKDAEEFTVTLGLLRGLDASTDSLRAVADQLIEFAIEPFKELAKKDSRGA